MRITRCFTVALSASVLASLASVRVIAAPNTAINNLLPGSALLGEDMNSDCIIDLVDVVMKVNIAVGHAEQSRPDQDGDGAVTAQDTVEAIQRAVFASYGDVTFDGVVNILDVVAVLQHLGDSVPDGVMPDVNADGKISLSDLSATLSRQGRVVWRPRLAAAVDSIFFALGEYRQHDPELFMRACGGGGPTADACDHTQGVSGSYPPDHAFLTSFNYPNNHLTSVSRTWSNPPDGLPVHGVYTSGRDWPGNHAVMWSQTWSPVTQHSIVTSATTTHSLSLSRTLWGTAPGHLRVVSESWPRVHEPIVSRSFPPNHDGTVSSQRGVTAHRIIFSQSWSDSPHNIEMSHGGFGPPAHGVSFSSTWPTNHDRLVSATWPGRSHHASAVSATWPSNHVSTMSQTWPPDRAPQWPAGHTGACSGTWGSPPPSIVWPVFPPDHSWFTTATDLLPLIRP